MSAISDAISTGLNPLRVTIPMTGVEWADKYFYLPEGSSHIAGHWTTQPVQVVMLNMMTNDAIKIVSVRKSARLGYTKILVAALLY
ncbi:phage terminase large subunit family protein, partial [Escherichia coli]|nr:phage terminase large subunit family protein [Escherichia coli]